MRVYAAVRQPLLSRSIHRINAAIRAAAPPEVEFVDEPAHADLQILEVTGLDSLDHAVVPRRVLVLHCYGHEPPALLTRACQQSVLAVCAYDLTDQARAEGFEFLLTPFGVDGSVFYDRRLPRDRRILTTGYDLDQEAIGECVEAARGLGAPNPPQALHVGRDFWGDRSVEVHEGVTDDQMAKLYSRARYVAGLRRVEGFELPVLEGLACGARPVCFDTPGYRRWFDGHAVFVPELPSPELTGELMEVLAREPAPVTVAERDEIVTRFGWPAICGRLWTRILELTS